jgi:hypothetical protein
MLLGMLLIDGNRLEIPTQKSRKEEERHRASCDEIRSKGDVLLPWPERRHPPKPRQAIGNRVWWTLRSVRSVACGGKVLCENDDDPNRTEPTTGARRSGLPFPPLNAPAQLALQSNQIDQSGSSSSQPTSMRAVCVWCCCFLFVWPCLGFLFVCALGRVDFFACFLQNAPRAGVVVGAEVLRRSEERTVVLLWSDRIDRFYRPCQHIFRSRASQLILTDAHRRDWIADHNRH